MRDKMMTIHQKYTKIPQNCWSSAPQPKRLGCKVTLLYYHTLQAYDQTFEAADFEGKRLGHQPSHQNIKHVRCVYNPKLMIGTACIPLPT